MQPDDYKAVARTQRTKAPGCTLASVEITTPRLHLREFTLEDVNGLFTLESDPDVVRYQNYEPRTEREARDYVKGAIDSVQKKPRRWYELAVTLDGDFIGRVGGEVEDRQALVWYAFLPSAQGKGYATEAMRAFLSALIREANLHRITLDCDPRNVASWRLAERLGFRREAHHVGGYWSKGVWTDSYVYALLTTEWK